MRRLSSVVTGPKDVLTLALRRRAIITQACELVESLWSGWCCENLFIAALDAHPSLPAEMQKRVIDLAEPVHANTAIVAPMRVATVLPGVVCQTNRA